MGVYRVRIHRAPPKLPLPQHVLDELRAEEARWDECYNELEREYGL
jgi:hypothetical protein